MKKRRITFKLAYLIYLGVLIALVLAAVLYVASLLRQYESAQPERSVRSAAAELAAEAAGGDFWSRYGLPEAVPGAFERGRDLQTEYRALLQGEGLDFTPAGGSRGADERLYNVERGGLVLAQVRLKAAGPAVT